MRYSHQVYMYKQSRKNYTKLGNLFLLDILPSLNLMLIKLYMYMFKMNNSKITKYVRFEPFKIDTT